MTLVELLVSMVILTMMVMLFSLVLKSSQTVVAASHATMRANAAAAAIADTIRKDVRRITQNGFLAIRQRADGSAALAFTTAGVSPSATGPEVAAGTVTTYGIDLASGTLWRRSWVLDTSGSGASDVVSLDPTEFYIWAGATAGPTLDVYITNILNTVFLPQSSPPTLTDVEGQWQILASNCSDLSIMWTDGADDIGAGIGGRNPDGNIDWYGILPGYPGGPGHPGGYVEKGTSPPAPEDAMPMSVYQALWTRENQSNWPVAIKITFVLTDPAMPEEFTGVDDRGRQVRQGVRYEVICPIGR